jgi:hypothetical protein
LPLMSLSRLRRLSRLTPGWILPSAPPRNTEAKGPRRKVACPRQRDATRRRRDETPGGQADASPRQRAVAGDARRPDPIAGRARLAWVRRAENPPGIRRPRQPAGQHPARGLLGRQRTAPGLALLNASSPRTARRVAGSGEPRPRRPRPRRLRCRPRRCRRRARTRSPAPSAVRPSVDATQLRRHPWWVMADWPARRVLDPVTIDLSGEFTTDTGAKIRLAMARQQRDGAMVISRTSSRPT